jgi:hypothetical protein
MARIRSIKPEYWADQDLAEQVSRDARLLYIGLWNLADEHCRLRGDPRYVKGQIFPYDDDLQPPEIAALLDELALAGKVIQFRTGTGTFIFLPKLAKNQRLEPEKVATKLPGPDDPGSVLLTPNATVVPDESESRTDEFAPDAEKMSLLYGTGSMEHVSPSSAEPMDADPDDVLFTPEATPVEDEPPLMPSDAPKKSWSSEEIDADPHWVAFWEAYPRKTDKGHARKAWLKVLRNGVPPAFLTEAAERFRDSPARNREIRFVAHPTTWLNGERFNDYAELTGATSGPRPFWEN